MATPLLGLALPTTGSLTGTWGDTVNNSITSLLDSAVAGTTTLSTDADVTLTTTQEASNQAREAIILWNATGTVTRYITAPAQSKFYVVINASSTQSIVLRGVGPTTGITIVAGEKCVAAWNGSDFVKAASSTAATGTVTSVGFTGGIVSVATPTSTPAFTIAGTSGGVPYFTSGSTWATSGVLASNAIVVGGGAGAAPSTVTTATGALTFLATPSSANLAALLTDETGTGANVFATSPTLVTPLLGTPTSGVLTNCTGLPLTSGVTGNLPVTNLNGGTGASTSTFWRGDGTWAAASGGGGGTVTSVSVVSGNGFAGTVANASSTPAITLSTSITGVLKGNGTAISAATAGTDYLSPPSGTSILKGGSGGALANAVAGTDYQAPITLTTTGTSGAATFVGNTLNIPQYSGGGGGVTTFSGGTTGLTPATATAGAITLAGTLAVANGGTGVTTSTGSGSVVLSTSPSLTTPALGTPVSGSLSNCTNIPVNQATGTLPVANGGTGVTTSTGSGSNVLSTSPTITTPTISGNTSVNGLTLGTGPGSGGTSNTVFGLNAFSGATTGASNTFIGKSAGAAVTSSSNNVAIGNQALLTATTAAANTAVGSIALSGVSAGSGPANNTAVGYAALSGLTTYSNASSLGANTDVTGSNQIQLGDAATTTYVYGTVQNRSDLRDKADVRDTQLGLGFINALRPVDYKWDMRESYKPAMPEDTTDEVAMAEWREASRIENLTHDGSKKRSRFHHGLIAQEVKAVLDAQGIDFGGYQDHSLKGGDDVLSIGYDELIAPLIKAIQELTARVQQLEAKNG